MDILINNPLPESTEPTFSKRDNIYRQNAKKRAIKTIAQARKARAEETARLEKEAMDFLINNPLPESTEPTFSKRDDIYRKNAKKRAIKTLTRATQSRKRKADKELADSEQRAVKFLREAPDTGVSGIPYKTRISKRDEMCRKKAKKSAVKYLTRREKRKRK